MTDQTKVKKIVNPDTVHAKSITHTVIPLADGSYQVVSGTSHKVYIVTPIKGQKGATCNCGWGQHREPDNPASGCSHTMAVYGYLAEVLNLHDTAAWITQKDAAVGLHQVMVDLGDGVTMTLK